VFAYYFLLYPSEYLSYPNETINNMSQLRNVQSWIGSRALDLCTWCLIANLHAAPFAALTFTRQKNSALNKTIGSWLGDPHLCHDLHLVARVVTLREVFNAPPATPLNAYSTALGRHLRYIQVADITCRLQHALSIYYPAPVYPPSSISARSTHAGGAMALFLCANVDRNCMQLVGLRA
jgi:hypothetical protein